MKTPISLRAVGPEASPLRSARPLRVELPIQKHRAGTLLDMIASVSEQLLEVSPNAMSLCRLRVRQEAEYPGPSTPNYDGLHPDAQAAFRTADEAYWNATSGRHLQIESGFRTVYRQAELYACWQLGQPGCNPADIPGASIHNYGVAIDIRDSGSPQVVAALDNNGWDRTHNPPEPWHWEPVGVAAHTAAVQRREEMRAAGSIARQWQSEWTSAKTKNDRRNQKIDEFNYRLTVWQPQWEQLRLDVESFNGDAEQHNSRVERWQTQRDAFNRRVERYNEEVAALQALRARIEQMEPGPERDRLIQEYNRRAEAAVAEQTAIEAERARLENELAQLEREADDLGHRQADIERRYASLNAEREALLRLRDEIERLGQEIERHLAEARRLLDEIARQVHP